MNNKKKKFLYISIVSICSTLIYSQIINAQTVKYTNPTNGHEYFLTEQLSWQEAQEKAVAAGGNLVTINDEEENAWLVKTFINKKVNFLWIGLSDRHEEGIFEWISGEPLNYTNWSIGEPNDNPKNGGEDFATLTGPNNPFGRLIGSWSDAPTQAKLRGIIEIEKN